MTGAPHVFASRAEYDALVSALVDTGIIADASNIYWDIRPSSHVETLEFRVADVCMTVDETVMIAGLLRALTRACQADWLKGTPVDPVRPELLRAAKWRASRFGLEGDLIDPRTHKPVPASALIEGLLAFLRPWLEEAGEWDELSGLTRATLARGSGAKRQRDALARSGRREDVVDLIIAETEQGIGIS
jgi:carboxylate-amine ligase